MILCRFARVAVARRLVRIRLGGRLPVAHKLCANCTPATLMQILLRWCEANQDRWALPYEYSSLLQDKRFYLQ